MRKEIAKFSLNTTLKIASIMMISATSSSSFAFKPGHGSVLSDIGAPLQITIPLLELTAQEASSLQARVANEDAWTKSGLTPPAALDSLKVDVVPGFIAGSRRLLITSSMPPRQSPVDVLIDITTSSGATQIQSSYLVTMPEDLSAKSQTSAGGSSSARTGGAGQNIVKPGMTLYSIALKNAVPGADVYQMLAALFEANPDAFISGNMNLLKAGAVLSIPDADTVRSIDKNKARKLFQTQASAFNEIRRAKQAARAAALARNSSQPAKSGTTGSGAEANGAQDQLRLTSNSPTDQKEDARTAAKNEANEINARIKILQENVDQLKNSTADSSVKQSVTTPSPTQTATSQQPQPVSDSKSDVVTKSASNSGAEVNAASTTNAVANSAPATGTQNASPITEKTPTEPQPVKATAPAADNKSTFASKIARKWNAFTNVLAENIVFALAGLIAFGALVIAWVMRRAGERLDEDSDDFIASSTSRPQSDPVVDISQKLDGIDLNLDSPPTLTKAP